jgi:hypothetical protein
MTLSINDTQHNTLYAIMLNVVAPTKEPELGLLNIIVELK